MSTPNELRVFISSTFRDLQEEREHLHGGWIVQDVLFGAAITIS